MFNNCNSLKCFILLTIFKFLRTNCAKSHIQIGRVYSTGLQGQVWQKTQVSQGKIFSAFCCHNNSPDRGIIKIHLRQHLYLMLTSKLCTISSPEGTEQRLNVTSLIS